eukprot:13529224-Alexandrium_andersonii.AAC.1
MNLNIRWESGRAASAPTLDGFSWPGQARLPSAGQNEQAVQWGTRGSVPGCAGLRQLRGLLLPRAAAAPLRAGGSGLEAGDSYH